MNDGIMCDSLYQSRHVSMSLNIFDRLALDFCRTYWTMCLLLRVTKLLPKARRRANLQVRISLSTDCI